MKLNTILAASLTLTSLTTTAFAEQKLDLDYLKLTPAGVLKREKEINKSLAKYDELTIGRISSLIEKTFGVNVFHHISDSCPELNNKKAVMYAAVMNIVSGDCQFGKYDTRLNPDNARLTTSGSSKVAVELNRISGDNTGAHYSGNYLLATTVGYQDSWIGYKKGTYTTAGMHIGRTPVFLDFLNGMRKTNLKALDTTVVFMNANAVFDRDSVDRYGRHLTPDISKKVLTIFPESSQLMPVPQPIMFVANDATSEEVQEAIETDASLIFTYNKVVSNSVMPSTKEIAEAVSASPELSAEVEALSRTIGRQAALERTKRAFLKTLFVTGAILGAPIAITAAVLNPAFVVLIVAAM